MRLQDAQPPPIVEDRNSFIYTSLNSEHPGKLHGALNLKKASMYLPATVCLFATCF